MRVTVRGDFNGSALIDVTNIFSLFSVKLSLWEQCVNNVENLCAGHTAFGSEHQC